jgi:hypothetical protein
MAVVLVRCRQCGAATSEWAAHCPHCRSALDHAEPLNEAPLIPEPPTDGPNGVSPRRVTPRTRTLIAWGLALLFTVLSAGVGWAVANHGDKRGASEISPSRPDHLADRLLFYAEPRMTGIVRADGTVIRTFPQTPAVGYPILPLMTAGRSVVFVHGLQAYRIGPDWHSPVLQVGAADHLFPADSGDVGLEVGVGGDQTGRPGFIEYVAADGTRTAPAALPPDTTAIARLLTGLLVITLDHHLEFPGTEASQRLGPVNWVVGTFVATVAWTDGSNCAPDSGSCRLHLTDTGSGADRIVAPPAGFTGFVGGGGFSPSGTWLAAFVYSPTATGPGLRLALINTRLGRALVVGPVLPAGETIGSAVWSPDTQWIFFSGLSGPMYAQRMAANGPVGTPVPLPLPASYAFAAL